MIDIWDPETLYVMERSILLIVIDIGLVCLLEHSPDLVALLGSHVWIIVNNVLELVDHTTVRKE